MALRHRTLGEFPNERREAVGTLNVSNPARLLGVRGYIQK